MRDAIIAMRKRVRDLREAGRKADAWRATPRYRAQAKLWLNDRLIDPFRIDLATRLPVPVEFYWEGAPGQAMRPLNESALEIFGHYRDWIGGVDAKAMPEAWVTANGVVVTVGARAAPQTAMLRRHLEPDLEGMELEASEDHRNPEFDSALAIDDGSPYAQYDPRRKETNILGTIAPTAKLGNQPEHGRGFA